MKAGDAEPIGRLTRTIREAFRNTAHPGDAFLQGSIDGCEPFEEVAHFKGKPDWTALERKFLDQRYCALGFLSEGGFRFYLPAYLVADVHRELRTADPVFHLTHGFAGESAALLNPRRYGAMTWVDYARFRLSVFTREEAAAIVAYLGWRRDGADPAEARTIDAALTGFWLERIRSAPTADDLARRLAGGGG